MSRNFALIIAVLAWLRAADAQLVAGELKQWHDVVLTFDGPDTSESADPNPFLAYRMNVTFAKGAKSYVVPGCFAADGNAAESSATCHHAQGGHRLLGSPPNEPSSD